MRQYVTRDGRTTQIKEHRIHKTEESELREVRSNRAALDVKRCFELIKLEKGFEFINLKRELEIIYLLHFNSVRTILYMLCSSICTVLLYIASFIP